MDLLRAVDNVVVRQDIAVGRHDDSGAETALPMAARDVWNAALPAARLIVVLAEEATEEVVPLELGRRHGRLALDTNGDDSGGDSLDDVGIRIAGAGGKGPSGHGLCLSGGRCECRSRGQPPPRGAGDQCGCGRDRKAGADAETSGIHR